MDIKMNDVYEGIPVFENDRFLLRGVQREDAEDLLKVYSDMAAAEFFNSDNCHGDDFHYETLERMNKGIDFWLFSYENKYFVRWTILDKACAEAVGTIELFHRDAEDYFSNCGLLRLDLRSDYETEESITQILNLIIPDTFSLFHCDKIATKAIGEAVSRRNALLNKGFLKSDKPLVGENGQEYTDYFVLSEGK